VNHPIATFVLRIGCGLLFGAVASITQATAFFTDRTAFITAVSALGIPTASDAYDTYPQGSLTNGQTLGGFCQLAVETRKKSRQVSRRADNRTGSLIRSRAADPQFHANV
jgi:hypothetical protein